jgi:hypothetical protein
MDSAIYAIEVVALKKIGNNFLKMGIIKGRWIYIR